MYSFIGYYYHRNIILVKLKICYEYYVILCYLLLMGELVMLDAPLPPASAAPSHNLQGRFVKGHHIGRPKGVKNAEKAYLRAAPQLAKAYIKTAMKGNATLLKDAREWIMPTDSEQQQRQGTPAVIIFAQSAPSVIPPS